MLHGHDAFRVRVKEEDTAVVSIGRRRGGVGRGGVNGWWVMRKGEEGKRGDG